MGWNVAEANNDPLNFGSGRCASAPLNLRKRKLACAEIERERVAEAMTV
jgi:hypothetical protein